MSGARLGAYAPHQLLDFATRRAPILALVIAFLAAGQISVVRAGYGPLWAEGAAGAIRAQTVFLSLLTPLAYLGTLLSVHGISSADRKHGYCRFLFAKPVGVVRYYAQAWALTGVGLVALSALFAIVFSAAAHPVSVAGTAAGAALVWLAVGGLGFLLSACMEGDGLVLLLLVVLGTAAGEFARARVMMGRAELPWLTAARYVLPPLEPLAEARRRLVAGEALEPWALVWIVGFGLICFAAGAALLRRRPLAA